MQIFSVAEVVKKENKIKENIQEEGGFSEDGFVIVLSPYIVFWDNPTQGSSDPLCSLFPEYSH